MSETKRCFLGLLMSAVGSVAGAQTRLSPPVPTEGGAVPSNALPVYVVQPRSTVVTEGSYVQLYALADSPAPWVSWQWYHDAQPTGWPHAPFIIQAATAAHAGEYYQVACNIYGCATSQVARLTVVPAGPLDEWTQVPRALPRMPLGPVAYGNGRFVIAAWDSSAAEVLRSEDGTNWVDTGVDFGLYYEDLIFADDRFVLVGLEDHGPAAVLTSSNGVDWSIVFQRDIDCEDANCLGQAAWQNDRFVVLGAEGNLVSTNGVNWLLNTNALSSRLYHLVAGNGLFLGATYEGELARSTNGLDWISSGSVPINVITGGSLYDLAYGNGIFLALGGTLRSTTNGWTAQPVMFWSPDGLTWSNAVSVSDCLAYSAAYGSAGFVALARDVFTSSPCSLTSADGLAWQRHPFPVSTALAHVRYGGGLYVASGPETALFISSDGIHWTQQAGGSTRHLRALAQGPAGALAVGERGVVLTSRDGTTWRRREGVTGEDLRAAVYHEGRYVAVGGNTRPLLLTSSDAETWQTWTSDEGGALQTVIADGTDVLALGLRGTVVRSSRGSWTLEMAAGAPDFRSVARVGGQFVAVARTYEGYADWQTPATLWTSPDGSWWTLSLAHTQALYAVAAGGGRAVAVGALGRAFVSTNGMDWQAGDLGVNDALERVVFDGGVFLAIGSRTGAGAKARVFYSTDGAEWLAHELGPLPYLEGYYTAARCAGFAFGRFFLGTGNEDLWHNAPLAPRFIAAVFDPAGGELRCRLRGIPGAVLRVQWSDDLRSWTDLGWVTNQPSQVLSLPVFADPSRFYRLVQP